MDNPIKGANGLHSKTFLNHKRNRIFRNGQWYTHTLMTNETESTSSKPSTYSPTDSNVLWSCRLKLKPGGTICTHGGVYIYKFINVQRENIIRRELRPVFDPTDSFNINRAKRDAKRSMPPARNSSPAFEPKFTRQATANSDNIDSVMLKRKLTILRNRIEFTEGKLRLCCSTIKTLRGQLQKQRKFKQDARRVHLSFQAEHKTAKDMNQQEVAKLKAENVRLHDKFLSLTNTHEASFTNLLSKIYDLAKLRQTQEGYKQCIYKQMQEIRKLKAFPELQHIDFCMRSFDTFCEISSSSAAQALSTPGCQLVKNKFISKAVWCTLLCVISYAGLMWTQQVEECGGKGADI
jgi:hypothetical protein